MMLSKLISGGSAMKKESRLLLKCSAEKNPLQPHSKMPGKWWGTNLKSCPDSNRDENSALRSQSRVGTFFSIIRVIKTIRCNNFLIKGETVFDYKAFSYSA